VSTPLAFVANYLTSDLAPGDGFFAKNFASERMYFTAENGARIDAARTAIERWHNEGLLPEDAYYLLLAGLLEGADRVANTAGVYAAFIKSWQPNAVRPVRLELTAPFKGRPGSTAHCADATEIARQLGTVELLYVDPPYNARQYPGYYHVPELIARGWNGEQPHLRGKTGLLPADGQRSAWCSARHVRRALEELLEATGARHVLVSYNSEGLLSEDVLRETLKAASIDRRVRSYSMAYRRYRADSDREGRRYSSDRVRELLVHARLRR
jgi:adenine-specific DNA-methyltransferase